MPLDIAPMAYKEIGDAGLLNDILKRKEFYQVRPDTSDGQNINSYDAMRGEYLELRGHQLFVNNFQSPNTKYMRLLLKHQTGVGKTLSSIAIAHTFISVYKKIYENTLMQTGMNRRGRIEADLITPSVFIIGFTKSIFIKEILKYPEFGFISYEEHAELERLRKAAISGMASDVERAKEFYSMLKRRITNKAKGGFYKFYGYQEFVNKLFYSDTINLTDLESIAMKKIATKEGGATPSAAKVENLEELIYYYMERGEIQVNTTLLKQFENSLLICDEIHNTYNSVMKNNYGVAIQYVLDYTPSLRALFLSATVAYHSPTEVIDLMNLLLPKDKKISKRDFFTSKRDIKPNALEQLGVLSRGYISFLQETNPEYYPEKIYSGSIHKLKSPINIGGNVITEIPYLNFVDCEMSEYHSAAYKEFLKSTNQLKEEFPVLPTDAYSINDLVYPVPTSSVGKDVSNAFVNNTANTNVIDDAVEIMDMDAHASHDATANANMNANMNTTPGITTIKPGLAVAFRSTVVRDSLLKASESWKKANGIELDVTKSGSMIVAGSWLGCKNISKYSTKHVKILDGIFNSFDKSIKQSTKEIKKLTRDGGVLTADAIAGVMRKNSIKIMIYHPRVKMSGVMQIEALLKQNGFIGATEEPTSKTICTFCGVNKNSHTPPQLTAGGIPLHNYAPARLIMAHSDFDKTVMDNYINMFNEPSNAYGEYLKCLVGSKIIRQSYDIKCVQLFYIVSLPISIPELIQILGRIARMDSHKDLPFDKRSVNINMLISTVRSSGGKGNYSNTYEEVKYVEKMFEYKIIQDIEREFNKNAIDADILRPTIMSEYTLRQYFGDDAVDKELKTKGNLDSLMYANESSARDIFGNLYYLPAARIPAGFNPSKDLKTNTFNAYGYFANESRLISYIIKQLFIQERVWKYDDLWSAVKEFHSRQVNTKLFDEGNFALVLNTLSEDDNIIWKEPILETNKQTSAREYRMIDESQIARKKMVRDLFSPDEKIITIMGGTTHGSSSGLSAPARYKISQSGEFYILFPLVSTEASAFSLRGKLGATATTATSIADEVMVRDVESYVREIKYSPGVRINLDTWIRESKTEYNYNIRKQGFIQAFSGANQKGMRALLWDYTSSFQRKLLKEIIEWEILQAVKITDELRNLYAAVVDLYDEFAAVIYVKDVLTYREVAKKFTTGKIVKWRKGESKPYSDIDKSTPIGFIDKDSVSLFDGVNWIKINKVAMNIRTEFQENNIIVGYLDDVKGTDIVKFKMRRPVHEIRSKATVDDIRMLERGAVCETKNKPELLKITRDLKINIEEKARRGKQSAKTKINDDGVSKIKIKNICGAIRNKLVDLEAAERQKDSKIKYFYMFYDSQPTVA